MHENELKKVQKSIELTSTDDTGSVRAMRNEAQNKGGLNLNLKYLHSLQNENTFSSESLKNQRTVFPK